MRKTTSTDWQSVGKWKNGRVRSGAKTMIWLSLLFGVAFTGISLPGVLVVPDELRSGNYAILAVLLFPLVGISALGLFVYSVLAWRKFGKTELVLDPVPGSIGGDFGGTVDIPVPWNPKNTVNITLNCQRVKTTGSGKNRSTSTSVIWQREGIATLEPVTNATRCSFRFAIPEGLPESEKNSSDYHQWLLQMDCELPGIDFKRNFTVPVFQTDKPQLSSIKADYAKNSSPMEKAPDGIVRIQQTPAGLQFYYPWHRHLWMGILTLIFGGIFAGIGIFIGINEPEILIPVVFTIVGGGCILLGLYLVGNTLTTTVSIQGINVIRNIYGIRFQRNVKASEITKLDRQIRSQMNAGSRTRVYYSIIAHTRDKRKVTIADTLEGSRLADFIEQRIREALDQKQSHPTDDIELVIP
jgi:hypothetical protein